MQASVLGLIAFVVLGGSASLAGWITQEKRRGPAEGILLGLCLGPLGVLIAARKDYMHRPPVDDRAWNTYRAMHPRKRPPG